MFGKRLTSAVVVLMMLFSSFTYVQAATPIGQEGTQGLPINSGMETDSEIAAINSQLTSTSGSAILSLDKKSGKYSAEIHVGDSNTGIQFTAVDSANYAAKEFGQIHLYVKPKAGAGWVQFYTNSSGTNVLLKSDANKDGRYEVGTDLISGAWNEVTLQLLDTDTVISTASDLIIHANGNSVWNLDEIKAVKTKVFSYDLSSFDNDLTEIKDGRLQILSNGTAGFTTTSAAVNSGMKTFTVADDTTAEFQTGTFSNTAIVGTNQVGGNDLCEGGTAISNGQASTHYAGRAFDNSESINSYWGSPNYGASVMGTDYIGYGFNTSQIIKGVYISQDRSGYQGSIKLQYYDIASTSWKDAQILNCTENTYAQTFSISSNFSSTQWRLLANAATTSNWCVLEVRFLGTGQMYTSAVKDITGIQNIQRTRCSWSESQTDKIKLEIRVSADGGVNWTQWRMVTKQEVMSDYQNLVLTNGKIQYRATIEGDSLLSNVYLSAESDSVKNTLPDGKISAISIDRGYYNSTGTDVAAQSFPSGIVPPDRYLLSFDGKNSWYAYKNGVWKLTAPMAAELAASGMTLDEINSLDKKAFAKLYENGKEIYTLDMSIYFASTSTLITPSIKSINVIMDSGKDAYQTGTTYDPIYSTKAKAFDCSVWRTIKKIYPVEISPKAAEVYYFALVGGEYKSMKGGTWETVGTLPENADSQWIDITKKGITAAELRQISGATLMANLTASTFSIISCTKAYDESTAAYRSDIYVDYTEYMFYGDNLALSITYNDGTTAQITGLSHEEVESFMAWVLGRQYGRGPIFYLIKQDNINSFVNYYMIQNVKVVE